MKLFENEVLDVQEQEQVSFTHDQIAQLVKSVKSGRVNPPSGLTRDEFKAWFRARAEERQKA